MPHSFGYRAGTRYLFARHFRKHGTLPTKTYLSSYHIGDLVDIAVNGNVHKGLPFKWYQGKTGRIWNVTPRAVGIEIGKQVGPRILVKRIHVRIEHVKPSKCRSEFLERVKKNDEMKAKAKESKSTAKLILKRKPALPRASFHVSAKGKKIEALNPQAYVVPFTQD